MLLFIIGMTAVSATVEGVVSDSSGNPISGAKVNIANPYGASGGVIRYVMTDSDGRFSMKSVKAGKYDVYAQKPTSGYGDPEFAFYSIGRPPSPQVDIKAADKSVNVIVNLGEPGGILKAAVVDEETGEPVTTARYRLSLMQKPNTYLSSSVTVEGTIDTPVPPLPLDIAVTALGYEGAHLRNVLIERRRSKTVAIKLRRLPAIR
jgi:hypothetical protein